MHLGRFFVIGCILVVLGTLLGIVWGQDTTPTEPPPFPTGTPVPVFPTTTATPLPSLTPEEGFPTTTATPLPTLPPTPTLRPTHESGPNARVVETACYLEPKWTYSVEVRRGPSDDWGIQRTFRHTDHTVEMWVFGRDEDSEWYHVVMPAPYDNQVGWVSDDVINLFGACDELQVDDDTEITIDEVPAKPEKIEMPEFARDYVNLTIDDRAYLLKPGILYLRREVPSLEKRDRIQAHMLIMDLDAPQLHVGVALGAVADRAGVPLSEMASATGAFAAINGDYYAGNYFPQGITVIDGEVVTAPKLRASFAINAENDPFIGYFTLGWSWAAYVAAENGEVIPLQLMNVPCETGWLCLYSHHRGGRLPESYRGLRVLLNSDYEVVDIVDNEGIDIPEGYFVLRGEGGPADWLRENVEIGDTLQIVLPTDPPWQDFQQVISGGPRVLVDGEFWQDCDPEEAEPVCEEFDFEFRDSHYGLKSLPRTAVGFNADANLLYTVVNEGYEVDDSGGMTQRELADMFLEFGATDAMEFDGGGSSTLYIEPEGVISDYGYEGERRVPNALLFFWEEG